MNLTTDLLKSKNNSYFFAPAEFGAAKSITGEISFFNSNSNFKSTFKGGNFTANSTYTLPLAGPSLGSFLRSDSSGQWSWESTGLEFGLDSPGTLSATAAAGGSLPNGTYYYKVYPYDANGKVGFLSTEAFLTTAGANGTVNLSWSAVPDVSFYRVTRGTAQGSQDGYYQVSTNSYSDTGAAFTGAGNGVGNANVGFILCSGTIDLQSQTSSIRWYNFTNQTIGAAVSATSAGELEFVTGKGAAQGNFVFGDSTYATKMVFQTETATPVISFTNGASLSDGVIEASNVIFSVAGAERSRFTSTGLTINPTSNQLVLGVTRTVTLTAPTPATASRTVTIPDLSGDYSVIGTIGAQTKSGAFTLSAGLFLTGGPTNAYDTTNILYLNSVTSSARVIRIAGATSTDQLIYSPASTDQINMATTSGTTVTDLFKMNVSGGQQIELGNGNSGTNIRLNTATTTGANVATLTNSPTTGNPTGWLQITVNDGTTRYVPYWT